MRHCEFCDLPIGAFFLLDTQNIWQKQTLEEAVDITESQNKSFFDPPSTFVRPPELVKFEPNRLVEDVTGRVKTQNDELDLLFE